MHVMIRREGEGEALFKSTATQLFALLARDK